MKEDNDSEAFQVGLREAGRVVHCRVTAPVTVALAKAFAAEMDRLGAESGADRFLTDVRGCRNVSRMAENYQYAHVDMAAMGLRRAVRAAILADVGDHSHDFVETAARNAGYNVRVFRSEADALAWLLGD